MWEYGHVEMLILFVKLCPYDLSLKVKIANQLMQSICCLEYFRSRLHSGLMVLKEKVWLGSMQDLGLYCLRMLIKISDCQLFSQIL